MANDIDMWSDIEELEKAGKTEEAKALQDLFDYRYIGGNLVFKNEEEFEKAKDNYRKLYGALGNYV